LNHKLGDCLQMHCEGTGDVTVATAAEEKDGSKERQCRSFCLPLDDFFRHFTCFRPSFQTVVVEQSNLTSLLE
jgi:hypothetical protein